MTNVGVGDTPRMTAMFSYCNNLKNVTLNNVGTGKNAELYQMFRASATTSSGTHLWNFTNVGKNNANLRAMFQESFTSANISSDSRLCGIIQDHAERL